ncbi:MAG: VWA domain-containing protein [Planktomarina sp.]|jgi:uncharacterized protein|nr:VWA domain-containing protein [Planktomarina sp.]
MADAPGRLPDNIVYFGRALRRAGVPVGTAQILEALRAVKLVGFTKRQDFHTTLRAMIVTRPEHLLIFDQVFAMFWRDPDFLENMITNLLPVITAPAVEKPMKPAQNRAAEAMAAGGGKPRDLPPQELLEIDAQFSQSDVEKLLQKDFEAMTAMEIRQAEQAIRSLRLDLPQLAGRRYEPVARALRIDRRKTVQQARRNGGEILTLAKRRAKPRKLNLVVLCDISGSMTRYSRMMMHFVHSCAQARGSDWAAVHAFTFGTQLHNISPQLGIKDPDAALAAIGQHVQDWEGGTRISASLGAFNRDWARRVLSTPAVVLLISDGLERSGLAALDGEMSRLALQARELIWLNPLLRWEQFSPQAAGIKAMLPHVSSLVACHNLSSLEDLSDHLNGRRMIDHKARLLRLLE